MRQGRLGLRIAAALLLAALAQPTWAGAAEIRVRPGQPLQPLIDGAAPGTVIRLEPGRHAGPIVVDRPLALIGMPDAALVGPGTGSVVTIDADDVRVQGLEIRGSGDDRPAMDSGILVRRTAQRAIVRGNRLVDNLFGVYLHGAAGSRVEGNTILGRRDVRMADAGNGVTIWNAPGAQVIGNSVRYGRDGIYVRTSRDNTFADNTFADLRFAIHYMYTLDSRIVGNRSRDNHVGLAIMFSTGLEILDNVSEGDRDHGLLLNGTNDSRVMGNVIRRGGEKCVFVYNANNNRLVENRFEGCPIGIHFTAGSEGNVVTGNAFVANRVQVKYVGTRFIDWAADGRGNYWSDNPAFDLDGDGIADRPYRPNDVMDEVYWTLPQAKLLASSPAVQMVRWAQARFPALYPGGVFDSAPLMRPPRQPQPEAAWP